RVRFPSPALARIPRSAILSAQESSKIRKPHGLGVPVAWPMADAQSAAWRPSGTPQPGGLKNAVEAGRHSSHTAAAPTTQAATDGATTPEYSNDTTNNARQHGCT